MSTNDMHFIPNNMPGKGGGLGFLCFIFTLVAGCGLFTHIV